MKTALICLAAAAATAAFTGSANAALLYSFETGTATNPDGFAPNGGGFTIAQTLGVGVTQGTHALTTNMVQGATGAGPLTQTNFGTLADPTDTAISFDVTIPTAFAGAYASVQITVFGASQADYPGGQQFGLNATSAGFVSLAGLASGSTTHLTISNLTGTNPLTFDSGQAFFSGANAIFGSGPNQLIPTGFELYINKSNDASLSAIFDNITNNVGTPEPASLGLLGAAGLLLARRRRA